MRDLLLFYLLVGLFACHSSHPVQESTPGYPITPIPFYEVDLQDNFWSPRLATQAETLVPFALEKTNPAVENLAKAARYLRGDTSNLPFPHRYVSSDLYKVMEGAALLLKENPDPGLEQQLDAIIEIIEAAQREDGYLYVAHITGVSKDHPHFNGAGMGDKPYSFVLHSHELYNMGHMYEAAIAYYQATGKDRWLNVAEKNAQHINRVFFEGDPDYNGGKPVNQAPGHQELELALVKLYQVTGKQLYLDMAERFLEIRGRTYHPEGEGVMAATYSQQHAPVEEQDRAVGHAVRGAYQYSAMADVGAILGKEEYKAALDRIWHNIVDTKMHITGGLGAVKGIEGFGPEYVLPNKDAYNETCAAVGNVFFNYRMFLWTGEARYLDVAEIALYNNALAGVNFAGNRFFYVNPLEADGKTPFNHGKTGRSPWFNTACCPSNLARLIPQVSGMMYARRGTDIYLNLYGSNQTRLPLPAGRVDLIQKTGYPFDGRIRLEVSPDRSREFALLFRVPTWTGAQFVPGALYQYRDTMAGSWQLRVNGEPAQVSVEKGFARLERQWRPGDVVELYLPMPVRQNSCIPEVEENRGRIAVSRGPLVYCAEGVDHPASVLDYELVDFSASEADLFSIEEAPLTGITALDLPARVNGNPKQLRLIPYYAWNNRGDASMRVWFPVGDRKD